MINVDAGEYAKLGIALEQLARAQPARRREALRNSIVEIQRNARKITKVAGGVFMRPGGDLSRGIGAQYGENGAELTSGVKYGLIHEVGGKTRPHRIEPRFAKVLAWSVAAGSPFANAGRIGRGKGRSLTARTSTRLVGRARSGGSVSGMYFHWPKGRGVNHPGSRIRPKRYSWLAYQDSEPYVLDQMFKALGQDELEERKP